MRGLLDTAHVRAFGAPSEYIQGAGALDALPQLASRFCGGRLVAIIDPALFETLSERLTRLFDDRGQSVQCLRFSGAATAAEASRLINEARTAGVIAGLGGGKCLDIGKLVALNSGRPYFSVPTSASCDAATSRLIVLYDEAGQMIGTRYLDFNPALVLVDTEIIAAAPVRLLRAGIGDALTKFYETRATRAAEGVNSFLARPTLLAAGLAAHCHEVVLESGAGVIKALQCGNRHAAFDDLIEAIILLSGLAFESGGLSVAHAMVRGMSRIATLQNYLHGEQVAYSTLVQLLLENDGIALRKMRLFNRLIGLPASLREMGIPDDKIVHVAGEIASATITAPYLANFYRKLDAAALVEAIVALERREAA